MDFVASSRIPFTQTDSHLRRALATQAQAGCRRCASLYQRASRNTGLFRGLHKGLYKSLIEIG